MEHRRSDTTGQLAVTTRLTVVRSGGVAGIERRGETELSASEHAALLQVASQTPLPPAPDRFSYALRWRWGGRHHRCVLDERALDPTLRALVQRSLREP